MPNSAGTGPEPTRSSGSASDESRAACQHWRKDTRTLWAQQNAMASNATTPSISGWLAELIQQLHERQLACASWY